VKLKNDQELLFVQPLCENVDINIVRLGRRKTTIINGITGEFDYKKIMKFLKKVGFVLIELDACM